MTLELRAVVGRDDVVGLLQEMAPLQVELSRRPRRAISVDRLTEVEFVPGTGLRVRGDARITWDLAGLSVPVNARAVELLLAPRLALRGSSPILELHPTLEQLDLESVPFFLDNRIVGSINDAIATHRSKLAWNIGRSFGFGLGDRVTPTTRLELAVTSASVVIDSDALVIDVSFGARAARVAPHLRAVGEVSGR